MGRLVSAAALPSFVIRGMLVNHAVFATNTQFKTVNA